MNKKLLFFTISIINIVIFCTTNTSGNYPDQDNGLTRRASTLAAITQTRATIQMPTQVTAQPANSQERSCCSLTKVCLAAWIAIAATFAGTMIYQTINLNNVLKKIPEVTVPTIPSIPVPPVT
jgi:hypothetical protein